MTARDELVELQRTLAQELKNRAYGVVESLPPYERAYFLNYKREFARPFAATEKKLLLDKLASSRIVYVGDYHTLRQAQKTFLSIARHMHTANSRLLIGLEMAHSVHQESLDRFLAGRIDETQLLHELRYLDTWGFNWANYRGIFEFARTAGVGLVGLNCSPVPEKTRLFIRDFHASSTIVRAMMEHPEHRILVFFGDIHIAEPNLPALVEHQLGIFGRREPWAIVFQNSETIHLKLAAIGMEHTVDVVQFSENKFCAQSTVPQVKYQSFVFWEELREQYRNAHAAEWGAPPVETLRPDETADEELQSGPDVLDLIHDLAKIQCRFLGLRLSGLEDFQVLTPEEGAAKALRRSKQITRTEKKEYVQRIKVGESFLVPEERLMYLHRYSMNWAAELAGRWVKFLAGGAGQGKGDVGRFYNSVMDSACGFFASLLINPKRQCYKPLDFAELARKKAVKTLDLKYRRLIHTARLYIKHQAALASLEAPVPDSSDELYVMTGWKSRGLSTALGAMLGERLFHSLLQERVAKQQIRELFTSAPAEPQACFELYRRAVDLTSACVLPFDSKHAQL